MNRLIKHATICLVLGLSPVSVRGQTDEPTNALRAASRRVADNEFNLVYKMQAGDSLTYEVEHLVKVATTIQGNTQRTQSRSKSAMVWKIVSVDAKTGHMTLTNAIEYVDMWNEAQNREATRYDSRSGDPPPAEFAQVASTVGKPLAEITVDRHGRVIKRDDGKQHDLGTGGLLVPLPEQPVTIDAEWSVPGAISVRLGDGTYKTVKTRQLYKLEKVQAGVATITTKTQLLTPNIDSRMRSQLMQKMTEGRIRFDLDAGRILSRQLDWDEDVVGFNGPQSNMEYLARHTEELTDEPKVAQRP